MVCLPEHWLLEHYATQDRFENEFREWARTFRIWLVPGANYSRTDKQTRIESLLISPDGRVVGRQPKVHLFRREKERATPGEDYFVFDADGVAVGIIVCYDNVFPEVARILALKGADILFLPSRIDAEGLEPWRLYVMTRALENRVPIVAPNIYAPPRFPGGSVIVDVAETSNGRIVTPHIIASIPARSDYALATINLDDSRKLRAARLADRRPETYREIIS